MTKTAEPKGILRRVVTDEELMGSTPAEQRARDHAFYERAGIDNVTGGMLRIVQPPLADYYVEEAWFDSSTWTGRVA